MFVVVSGVFRRFNLALPLLLLLFQDEERKHCNKVIVGDVTGTDLKTFLDHKNSWGEIAVDLNLEKIGLKKNILCERVILNKVSLFNPPYTQQFCH